MHFEKRQFFILVLVYGVFQQSFASYIYIVQHTLLFQKFMENLSLTSQPPPPNTNLCNTCPTPTICNYKHPVSCVIEGHYGKANCISVSVRAGHSAERVLATMTDAETLCMSPSETQAETNAHPSLLPSNTLSLFLLSSISTVTSRYKQQNAFIQCWIISGCLITEQLIAFMSAVVGQRERVSLTWMFLVSIWVWVSVFVTVVDGRGLWSWSDTDKHGQSSHESVCQKTLHSPLEDSAISSPSLTLTHQSGFNGTIALSKKLFTRPQTIHKCG